ncbi:polysaccharide biosynthesis/export family protein [Flavobacterium daejeonense]|uniref:polysaccharide biosynthesis/export family protein n=1 Tax=Flavobacterium daejeonense TaxID=350893 RepID=UPI00047B7F00|nr:polysaccharide biosynthesis/export family protein [Flavobacterium daejeonense]
MGKYLLGLWLSVSLLLSSCISTRDLVYLQNKNETTAETTISEVVSKPYRLQTNDVLSISIKANDPKLVEIFSTTNQGDAAKSEAALYFNGFTVDDHGNIRMPVLGELNVIGYTLDEVRQRIEKQLLEEYFRKEANIFVIVKLAGFRYTINGEVGSTGTKTLFQEHVNILEAVANAGDITLLGNRKAVSIIRKTPTGSEIHDIDLTDSNVMNSPYFYLQPNDYIYVKPLRQKTWGTGKTGIESLGTILTLISLGTTVLLLLKR